MLSFLAILLISQQSISPGTQSIASYYTVASSSTLTASGETMVDEAFTCAMREGDFGSYLRVSSVDGKSVVVRLNDRGPYIEGRDIDLSEAAMRVLDPSMEKGVLKVTIEQVDETIIPPLF
jgi:rare lipoprotein A